MAAVALEMQDGCVPGGSVVDRDVGNGGVCCHHYIGLVRGLVGDAVKFFCMPAQTEGTVFSVGGGGVAL